MKIKVFVCNPFEEHTYIVYDESGEALIIDPGFYDEREFIPAKEFIEENHLKLRRLLNTHLHLDHSIGNRFIEETFGVSASASKADEFLQEKANDQAVMFGLPWRGRIPEIKTFLKEGDSIDIGSLSFRVLEVPGHTPGGLAFYEKNESTVFAGDSLFCGGIGRTDLPGGSERTLLKSIHEKLLTLPKETIVLPGHGPSTTIADEIPNSDLF
ncbi:MAG: MBL fold metallo-hydrolase [Fibrobacteraceae bacterium]|nr:MBL fold metallo-hydrolase [Fibrobacteraceae bacterium]